MAMTALERCKHFGVGKMQGMAYHPGPSNYTKSVAPDTLYAWSDFYNNIFTQLWSTESNETGVQGRGDLKRFHDELGINFIHCYDWSRPITQFHEGRWLEFLNHKPFFKACHELGMKVTIPISNYVMQLMAEGRGEAAREIVVSVLEEVGRKPDPAAGMIKIFNEYEISHDRNPKHVVEVLLWILDWEGGQIPDQDRLPIMVCTSFGMKDGIEGAGAMKAVYDELMNRLDLPNRQQIWRERMVFATNPQREGSAIKDYLENRLPAYWEKHKIPTPPVMFTELGSSIQQTGSEKNQAEWLAEQISASTPGSSKGNMLGACVFLNEERPWETGGERTFGIMRFGPDSTWGRPQKNGEANTQFPVWDNNNGNNGWWWAKKASYPVEQQAPKMNYQSVADAWGRSAK